MFARPLFPISLGLSLVVAPALAAAQRLEYAAGTTRYAITTNATGYAERMGQREDVNFDTEQRVTLTIARHSKDTLDLTMTLDSLAGRLPNGMPIDGSAARGLKVIGTLSPVGRIYTKRIASDSASDQLRQSAEEMIRFLPVLPADLKVGSTWSDTTASPVKQMGLDINRQVVTVYKVVGDTTYDGEKSWRIARAATVTLAGSGTTMGQPVTLEGGSTGTGTYYLSTTGTLLGADLKDEVKSKVTLVSAGMDVTSNQTQVTKIARAK